LKIVKSTSKNKKWTAIFCLCKGETKCCDKERKKIHFGDSRYEDYTQHKDVDRRKNYRSRHASGKTAKPDTADALSYYILWGDSTNLNENINSFKKKYNL
tara:strand:- start:280 stop:579 length:300 start_codon:yes stop_codon:yes gene_type:complete